MTEQQPTTDGLVEAIERATGLNGNTLLEQLVDQGLTVVARVAPVPGPVRMCEAPASTAPSEDCPHAAPFRYCDGCKVSPCPVGLGGA